MVDDVAAGGQDVQFLLVRTVKLLSRLRIVEETHCVRRLGVQSLHRLRGRALKFIHLEQARYDVPNGSWSLLPRSVPLFDGACVNACNRICHTSVSTILRVRSHEWILVRKAHKSSIPVTSSPLASCSCRA